VTGIEAPERGSSAPVGADVPGAERIDPREVGVIVPAYNERGKIGEVVRKVPRRWAATVIVVDDCSRDGTADEAREAGAERVIVHEANRGVGAGIRTGLFAARDAGLCYAAILSGDDQHEPDQLPRVLAPLVLGEADLVQGSRWLPGGATPGIPGGRRWLTRLYPWLFRIASGYPSTDGTNGFRCSIIRASASTSRGSIATSSSPICCTRPCGVAFASVRCRSPCAIIPAARPRCT